MSKTTFSKFTAPAAAKAEEPAASAPASAAPPTTLTLFGGAEPANALMAVVDQAGSGGRASPFPVIDVTGGNTGGLFSAVKGTAEQDVLDMLPQGGKPVKGIFLAWRTEILAWPAGYQEGQSDRPKPVWSAVISPSAVGDAQAAYKACEAYQFTAKASKAKFDYEASQVGHLRPCLQMLVFLPEISDVVVVQVPAYFSSWLETQKSLRLLVNPETKQLGQFPCAIRVISTETHNKDRSQTWMVHHCDVTQALDTVTKDAMAKYQPWLAAVRADQEKMAVLQEWMDGADRPMTDEHRVALRKAATL